MTKSLCKVLKFIKSSQRLCQHFNSKVKVSYLILNIVLLHYSFRFPYKYCFLNNLCLCSLFICEQN